MFGLRNISLDFLTSIPLLVSIGLVVLAGLAVLLYRRTNPQIPNYLRIVLAVLRAAAILAIIIILLEPVLSYQRQWERPRRISVLIDESSSMDRQENGKSRTARLDSLLSSPGFTQLKGSTELAVFHFGGNLANVSDKVDRGKTALGDALHDLAASQMTQPADAWLVFSDGKSNTGRTPAEAAATTHIPVYAVNMATDVGNFDIALDDIDYNPIVFVGQPTDVKVKLSWHNAVGKSPKIQMLDDNRPMTETSFQISEEGGRGEANLRYTPTSPGQKLFKVSIPVLEGEENDGNNARTISVKVLKSRLAVLLVASRPDYEVGFLRRHLLQSDKYDVDFRATGARAGNLAGQFPASQTELNRYDLVILYDPDPQAYAQYQQELQSYLKDKGGALWVFLGEQFANRGPVPWFNDLLPFAQSSRRRIEYMDFHGEPSEDNLFHPTVRFAEDRVAIRDAWNNLPPFKSLVRMDRTDPNGVILAYAAQSGRGDMRTPILGYKRLGPGKVLASAALPFWTWGFGNLGFGGSDSTYTNFVEGTSRWLTVRDDFDPIRVVPEKEVFTRGEQVRFNGFAFDQGYRPIPAVSGTVKLIQAENDKTFEADLLDKGEGKYEAMFDQLPPGRYMYSAVMTREGTELKRNEGNILVETFSLEEFDQTGDATTLQAVARETGGQYFTFRDFDNTLKAVDQAAVVETQQKEVGLWNQFWLLAIFIGSLSAEWVIRKTNQLL